MGRHLPSLLLVLTCVAGAQAQTIGLLGGSLTIEEGTTLQLSGPLEFVIQPGASVINNGTMDLGMEASLTEPDGGPIHGSGVEMARTTGNGPFASIEPAALGLTISGDAQSGPVTVIRGHTTSYFPEGDPSIARWYTIEAPLGGSGPLDVVLRYDASELNALSGTTLGLFRSEAGNGPWSAVVGTNDAGNRTVSAILLAPWATITAFDANAPTASPTLLAQDGLHVWPTLTIGDVHINAQDGKPFGTIDLFDALGRPIPVHVRDRRATYARLDLASLASGAYFLRVDGRSTFKLRKE